MTSSTRIRRFAIWLTRRTSNALPISQRDWANAMFGELDHIDNDGEALKWAVGCYLSSHIERLKAQAVAELFPVRAVITVLLAWHVFNDLFASVLTLAYKTQTLQFAEWLGHLTPNGDYRLIIPLVSVIPLWLYAISITAAAAYGVAGVRYLTQKSSPLIPFVVGFVLDIAVWMLVQPFEVVTRVNGANDEGALFFCVVTFLPFVILWRRHSQAQLTT